ncbi:MAG: type III pantothenate kinase [Proteobacteria bacterium]|nr:type III pantothenate kinase [Pseudomonadota bacterium]
MSDGPPVARVLAATVAGRRQPARARSGCAHGRHARVDFAASTAALAGVRNAYPDPGLLGVDRWVAVIGAYHLAQGACCVVDVGAAATLDTVDASGQHLGGSIVPGPQLMVRSPHAGQATWRRSRPPAAAGGTRLFADNTRDAIERGCRLALAALVDRTCAELARGLDERKRADRACIAPEGRGRGRPPRLRGTGTCRAITC